MKAQFRGGLPGVLLIGAGLTVPWLLVAGVARADGEVGRVTMMAGAPRMVGESIRPLQTIFSGRVLETGEGDAAGLLIEDVVIHIGANSRVTVLDEPGGKRILIESGFAVFYTEPTTRTSVAAETPFGRLSSSAGMSKEGESGWFSVRHDPEQANVASAVSTFAAMEGRAEVEGTVPEAGPYMLEAGQRWQIVQGRVPGPPEEGDGRAAAEALRRMLHREAIEDAHAGAASLSDLAADLVPAGRDGPEDVIAPEGQGIVDASGANQDLPPGETTPSSFTPEEQPQPEVVYAIATPTAIPAGTPERAVADFVGYDGVPAEPAWNQSLTSVGGEPAFQPSYVTEFANGGFSYIQFAGADAQVVSSDGEFFLAAEENAATGWAIFTPQVAIGDSGFDPGSDLATVVTDGFRAIAQAEHLAPPNDITAGGAIGGNGVDPATAFANFADDGNLQINPDQPAGYPILDQALNTTGLTVGGDAVSDQIAALGAGRDPQNLDQVVPQLIFLSTGETDANGSGFNFAGEPIVETELDLPGDRTIRTDNSGAPSLATPLTADGTNSVGIQFAGTGSTVAIVHHTGLGNPTGQAATQTDHFELVRGTRDSVVRWREDGRVTGADGQVLELEDLNERPDIRNELFALIGEEVNDLAPDETHTVFGPALAQPEQEPPAQRLRRTPGRLTRMGNVVDRRQVVIHRGHTPATKRSLKVRPLTSAGGRLIQSTSPSPSRRHIGRVSTRK